jgi:hypothetical protein
MQTDINITMLLGSILSVLFSLIAFFARQLHGDVKKMELNLAQIKLDTELIKANMQSESSFTRERINTHEKRIEQLENKYNNYEKKS